ncbi:MAG: hypothetical protein WBC51_01380 [Vicinamibacterales bacterium]
MKCLLEVFRQRNLRRKWLRQLGIFEQRREPRTVGGGAGGKRCEPAILVRHRQVGERKPVAGHGAARELILAA